MPLSDSVSMTVVLPAAGALLGSAIGALVSYRVSLRAHQIDQLKLISSWTKSEELEKARIAAYRELWRCLDGISTRDTNEIVSNLPAVQKRLEEWYYGGGGGLFLTGSAEKGSSTKALFFAARDLKSSDFSEIWQVFHRLRRGIRRDLGIFESDSEKKKMQEELEKMFETPPSKLVANLSHLSLAVRAFFVSGW